MLEGFYTSVWKKPIIIETEDYPQLENMSECDVLEYLNKNSHNLPAISGGDPDDWSLYDEMMNQDIELQKEKNNEISVELWSE